SRASRSCWRRAWRWATGARGSRCWSQSGSRHWSGTCSCSSCRSPCPSRPGSTGSDRAAMEYVLPALEMLATPAAILAMLAGTAFGIIIGALPGLGSVVAITVILPFTFTMDIIPSVVLVLAVYCASVYGGSVSAILINTPGTPQSAATVLDGFPMAQRGEADLALGWAT